MRRFQVSQRVDHLFIDVKTWANRMIPFKNLIIRLFEGKGRASSVKKKVGHRSNHDSRNYI